MPKNGPAARRRNTASVAFLPQFPLARNRVPTECAPMILFSVGLPGRFAAWCDAAVARLAGEAAIIGAETPDEVAAALIRSAEPNLVVAARCPTPALRTLLIDAEAPIFVAVDDPRQSLFHLVAEGHDFRAATRVIANSGVAAAVCASLPKACLLRPGETPDMFPPDMPPYAPPDIESWWEALDPAIRTVADGALRESGEITWDRSLLWLVADPARHAGSAIEIGDPGPLVAGPEIGLPPGNWAASVTLAVSREAVGAGFAIEIRGPEPLASAQATPDARGLCAATLVFPVAPAGQTISFSIASTAPVPGGRLALGNVVLVPSHGANSVIPSELTAVLDL
ncbi:MAG TPA: hypothetical protein VFW46_04715 [Stellaceae bacterium]|nr:hypothetical protein [Stellaceae bacterium]